MDASLRIKTLCMRLTQETFPQSSMHIGYNKRSHDAWFEPQSWSNRYMRLTLYLFSSELDRHAAVSSSGEPCVAWALWIQPWQSQNLENRTCDEQLVRNNKKRDSSLAKNSWWRSCSIDPGTLHKAVFTIILQALIVGHRAPRKSSFSLRKCWRTCKHKSSFAVPSPQARMRTSWYDEGRNDEDGRSEVGGEWRKCKKMQV